MSDPASPADEQPVAPRKPSFAIFPPFHVANLISGTPVQGTIRRPLSERAAVRVWDRIQASRRVSGASLSTFAAVTGYMPTLQAGFEVAGKQGTGYVAEFWRLEEADDRLQPNDHLFIHLTTAPPEIIARDNPLVAGAGSEIVSPCAICGEHFQPGEYIREFPFRSHRPDDELPPLGCGLENCMCHMTLPAPGTNISAILVHSRHVFEDESHHVPLPTPEQAREQRARRLATESMKRDWRYRWMYLLIVGLERLLEYGANKGWWTRTNNRTI